MNKIISAADHEPFTRAQVDEVLRHAMIAANMKIISNPITNKLVAGVRLSVMQRQNPDIFK